MDMFRDKSPDLEDGDYETREGLLAKEQDQDWTHEEEIDTCGDWATVLLQVSTLGVFFLLGILFGFMWQGDLDSQCSEHVSQYCKAKLRIFQVFD